MVEASCSGRQPVDLTAEKLTRTRRVPLAWNDQERLLGFN